MQLCGVNMKDAMLVSSNQQNVFRHWAELGLFTFQF